MSQFFTPFNLPADHALIGALPDCLEEYVHRNPKKKKETVINRAGEFGPSRASQAEAKDADINTIVARFSKTGVLPNRADMPMAGDFTEMPDLRQSLEQVRDAQEKFGMLPSNVRDRFNNDPTKLVEFCLDPANSDELVKLGLASKRPVDVAPEPMLVRIAPDSSVVNK